MLCRICCNRIRQFGLTGKFWSLEKLYDQHALCVRGVKKMYVLENADKVQEEAEQVVVSWAIPQTKISVRVQKLGF